MASNASEPTGQALQLEAPNGEQQLKDLSGTSREELEALVKGLVGKRIVSAETINNELDQIRVKIGELANAASAVTGGSAREQSAVSRGPEIIISSPEKKLLGKLEEDYEKQAEDLRVTGQANENMFSRLQIIKALTPEVLARALRIEKLIKGATPKGLLVPDNDRHEKVTAINDNKVPGQEYVTPFYDAYNKDLWNGGQEWPEHGQWQYKIIQGEQDVADDSKIRGTNFDRAKAWVAKIEKAGLDVLSGADTYLAAMRQALVEGKPLDPNTFTVLNAKNLTNSSRVAIGNWTRVQVYLYSADPVNSYVRLRARASVGVDVPKA